MLVLNESFPMNTNMTGLRWFSQFFAFFVPWKKVVASASEGLTLLCLDLDEENMDRSQQTSSRTHLEWFLSIPELGLCPGC